MSRTWDRKRIAPAIANASQSDRKTSPAPETEAEAATEAAAERSSTTRVAGFTTSSSYVPREVVQPRAGHRRDVMVSATRLHEHADLQTIEHLDFDPEIPCGCWDDGVGEQCPRTADVIVEDVHCPHCSAETSRWVCSDVCWAEMAEIGTECATCGTFAPRDEALRLVGRLR